MSSRRWQDLLLALSGTAAGAAYGQQLATAVGAFTTEQFGPVSNTCYMHRSARDACFACVDATASVTRLMQRPQC
jgi:hypothetical protein